MSEVSHALQAALQSVWDQLGSRMQKLVGSVLAEDVAPIEPELRRMLAQTGRKQVFDA